MNTLLQHSGELAAGALYTLAVAAVGVVVSLLIGTALGIVVAARPPVVRWAIYAYSEVVRNTPELVQLFWIYLVLPSLGINLTVTQAVLAYLCVNGIAYCLEVVRGGVEAVPRGQREACRVLSLSRWRTYRKVIVPQAMRSVVPSLMNEIIRVLKNTTLVSLIAAPDLVYYVHHLSSSNFEPVLFQLCAGGFYFVVITLVSMLARRIRPLEVRRA